MSSLSKVSGEEVITESNPMANNPDGAEMPVDGNENITDSRNNDYLAKSSENDDVNGNKTLLASDDNLDLQANKKGSKQSKSESNSNTSKDDDNDSASNIKKQVTIQSNDIDNDEDHDNNDNIKGHENSDDDETANKNKIAEHKKRKEENENGEEDDPGKNATASMDSMGSVDDPNEDLTPYTWDEIHTHNNVNDIWIVVKDRVYDVTKYLEHHPGGPQVIMNRAGKNATVFFDNVGHSDFAKNLMNEKYLIGKVDYFNRKRRYSTPEVLASDWHEARRLAMLNGRHGKVIQEWMDSRDWKPLLHIFIITVLHLGTAFALGYFAGEYPLWALFFISYILGAWCSQGYNFFFHELCHNNVSLDHDALSTQIFRFWLGGIILSDFSVYYGPFHSIHHKYLGMTGRDQFIPNLKKKYPVKDYPIAERTARVDFNIDLEGWMLETPENLAPGEIVQTKEKIPPWGPKLFKIMKKHAIIFCFIQFMIQMLRKTVREFLLAPLMTIVSFVKFLKHLKLITFASEEKIRKSTAEYTAYEIDFFIFYASYLVFNLCWLWMFQYIPDNSGELRGSELIEWNWHSWFYLQLATGVAIRNCPIFSLYGAFWCGDHTGYKHDPEKNATGIPDNCQHTVSYYGWDSFIIMHAFNYHCEHHDHPNIPAKFLWQLKGMYPEYYEHLNYYQNDYFRPMWLYIADRGVGWKYVHCD